MIISYDNDSLIFDIHIMMKMISRYYHCVVEITAEGRLASNCLDAWANAGFTASSHTESRTLDCCTIN